MKLYKYIPSQYTENFVKKGDLLFRNLSYFRQYEDNKRGDPLEGFHRDNPDSDVTLSDRTGKILEKGDYSFLNSTDTDLINVFCLSMRHDSMLYEEFSSDCCIEILDANEFIRKTRIAIKRLISIHMSGLLHREVVYYHDTAPAKFDIKNPQNLAFAKGMHYEHQQEYRMVFGRKKAFSLTQQIVMNDGYDFIGEAMKGTPQEKHIYIGNLSNIVEVHNI